MNRKIEIAGFVSGRLTGIKEDGSRRVFAKCVCGTVKSFDRNCFICRKTFSCGCLRNERIREVCQTHGHKPGGNPSPTYRSWQAMKHRCENPNQDNYKWYGGRGIKVCPRWAFFENFLADMGERPAGKELGRDDDRKDYGPENCSWVTHRENVMNKD